MQRHDDDAGNLHDRQQWDDQDAQGAATDGEVIEDAAPAGAGDAGDPAAVVQRLLDEQRDKYLRLAAEYDNYRRRTGRERVEAEARGQSELVKQLLDPLDDLSRFAAVDPAAADASTIAEGATMVHRKIHKVLAALGLEVVDPVDQGFDPNLHEAVATEPAQAADGDGIVARVYQQGYRFNGQLLRPARVVVKQWNG
jgi:molecular chaperone GrpE